MGKRGRRKESIERGGGGGETDRQTQRDRQKERDSQTHTDIPRR